MTGVQHDGLPAQQADPDDFRSFPSLAKSLSAMSHSNSTGNGRSKSPRGSRAPSPLLRNGLDEEEHGFIKSLKDPQLFVDIPKVPRATEAALAALQYLPTPLLVLSSLKTIILANDAMGRLLGFDADDGVSQEEGAATKLDLLHGQSLSQIGIDVIEDGQSIWISWEVCEVSCVTQNLLLISIRNFWTILRTNSARVKSKLKSMRKVIHGVKRTKSLP